MNTIAIIGLTNVGKSHFFNKLIGFSMSMEKNQENTTIDCISYVFDQGILFDTPGIDFYNFHPIIHKYIKQADILFVVIKDNYFPNIMKQWLQKINKKIVFIHNMIASINAMENLPNYPQYHITEIDNIKKKYNLNKENISTNITKQQIILIGQVNSGKSTLMNKLLKEERSLVSATRGTTTDAVIEEREDYIYIDTPGYERKNKLEEFLCQRRQLLISKAEIIILLLDFTQNFTHIEKKIINLIYKLNKCCIIAVNKKDIVSKENLYAFDILRSRYNYDYISISAKNNNITPLVNKIQILPKTLNKFYNLTIKTINKWLHNQQDFNLFSITGKKMKIKYIFPEAKELIIKYFAKEPLHMRSLKALKKKFILDFQLEHLNIFFIFKAK